VTLPVQVTSERLAAVAGSESAGAIDQPIGALDDLGSKELPEFGILVKGH
jgi:hypothetical protein